MAALSAADPYDAKDKALDALLAVWLARLSKAVADRVEDARAHAEKAVTDTLRSTPDGRKSLAKIAQSRSFASAQARLDDLRDKLTGKSDRSLKGKVRDARAEFYTLAVKWHRRITPAEIRSDGDGPTAAQVDAARAAAVHGYDPRRQLDATILMQKLALRAALEQAARSNADDRRAADLLDGWQSRAKTALTNAVRGLLVDSRGWCDTQASLDSIAPEFLD